MDIQETINFIKEAHKDQTDKTGMPYWEHPYRVMLYIGKDASDIEKHASLLHDVLEDTLYTEHDLLAMGYSEETITIIKLLTKDKTLSYVNNITKITNSKNKSAIKIKIADIMDNTDPNRLSKVKEPERLLLKYRKGLRILLLNLLNDI